MKPLARAAHLAIAAALGGTLALANEQSHAAQPAAAPVSEVEARELFQQGNRLIEQAQFVDALAKFLAAYAAWQNPKIKLNIATTLRALGRNAAALEAYRDYLKRGEPSPERRAEVEAIAADLEARVAHVQLRLEPGVQRVTLDGQTLPSTGLDELAIEPGRHVLLAETQTGAHVTAFEIGAGEHKQMVVSNERPGPPNGNGRDSAALPANEPSTPLSSRPTVGIVTRLDIDGNGQGAVGAAGLVLPFGAHWQASIGGLLGAHAGAWAGIEFAFLDAALTPTLGLSAPVFLVDGPRLGVSGEVGARWAVSEDFLFLAVRAALVHFPRLPAAYTETVLVPSISTELRL